MSTQTFSQIYRSLGSVYNPQVGIFKRRMGEIPGMIADEEKGLQARQTQAFDDILGGARRRGLGFAGIPLQEQAKYTSTEYLPELARLRRSGREQATSLEEAILGIRERQSTMARQIHEGVLSRMMANKQMAEQRRQFNASLARSGGGGGGGGFTPSFGDIFGGGGSTGGGKTSKYTMTRRPDGSFAFVDPDGKAVSAATYSYATNTPFTQLLQTMAKKGDKGAQVAYQFVGDDYGYNPNAIGNNAALYNALTWGLMPGATNATTSSSGSNRGRGNIQSTGRWY